MWEICYFKKKYVFFFTLSVLHYCLLIKETLKVWQPCKVFTIMKWMFYWLLVQTWESDIGIYKILNSHTLFVVLPMKRLTREMCHTSKYIILFFNWQKLIFFIHFANFFFKKQNCNFGTLSEVLFAMPFKKSPKALIFFIKH